MAEWKFFVPGHIEGTNKRQKKHYHSRSKEDKAKQRVWGAIIHSRAPVEAFVDKPHQKRQVALCVLRRHELDYDNLVGGLKPFIDVLRCWKERRTQVVAYKGVIFDDTPEFVNWRIGQAVIGPNALEGIWVTVSDAPPDVPYTKLAIVKTRNMGKTYASQQVTGLEITKMMDAIARGEKPKRFVIARPDGDYEVTVKRRKP